ncbi:MAG: hypothetical protein J0I07_34870 [Myxococcales bacterium]|nr:hypothetical protein [Myxococcales bacterium]
MRREIPRGARVDLLRTPELRQCADRNRFALLAQYASSEEAVALCCLSERSARIDGRQRTKSGGVYELRVRQILGGRRGLAQVRSRRPRGAYVARGSRARRRSGNGCARQ